MFKTKLEQKKSQVVTEEKVSIRKTLMSMNVGDEREFSCLDFSLSRCRVTASQIKKSTKREYHVRSNEFGTTFYVTRRR